MELPMLEVQPYANGEAPQQLNSGAPRPETAEDCAGESGNPIYVDGTLSQPQLNFNFGRWE